MLVPATTPSQAPRLLLNPELACLLHERHLGQHTRAAETAQTELVVIGSNTRIQTKEISLGRRQEGFARYPSRRKGLLALRFPRP